MCLVKRVCSGKQITWFCRRLKQLISYSLVLGALLALTAAGLPLTQPPGPAFLVKDINQDQNPYFSGPAYLTNVNGTLFFHTDDTIHGRELWKSDGSAAGTILVKDMNPGMGSSSVMQMANVNGTLFFLLFEGLGRSDGTESGTALIKAVEYPLSLTNVDGRLFFSGGNTHDELWTSDGSAEGTILLQDFGSDDYRCNSLGWTVSSNGTLFFSSSCGGPLWKSNGTADGTVLVKDIEGPVSWLHDLDGTLFFIANYNELWKSDGTEDGTILVKDTSSDQYSAFSQWLTTVNGRLFFSVGYDEYSLWTSDGTADGTVPLKSFGPGELFELTDVNGILYFVFVSRSSGICELWRSDGTQQGTVMVKDLSPSSVDLAPGVFSFTNVDGALLFTANDGVHGAEPWISYGTPDSTVMVQDIAPGETGSLPYGYTIAGSFVFFKASDGSTGRELWAIPLEHLTPHRVFLPTINKITQ